MSEDLMNTKEVARYLGIHEKQVYALIKAGRIPASRITGKWTFPKKLIDEWVESSATASLDHARSKKSKVEGSLLAAGSDDPILGMLLASYKTAHPDYYIFSAVTGSTEGLRLVNRRLTDIAWCHLFDPESGRYNTREVLSSHLTTSRSVVVHLFNREMGLVTSQANPKSIRGINDLTRDGVRIINRQEGSGTRLLLDYYLKKLQIDAGIIDGYREEVSTHMEVGLSVLSGSADTGIATIAIAKILGLTFHPLTLESFDMILDQSTFFERGVQAFIDVLQSPDFQKKSEYINNYDFKNAGKVLQAAN
ncbi:MAG: helix-turn-helix transcriptional regulator [Deltaproteobacteria bacterium]|nr:helix-turn-helix transcriptional regulator [Deltaproteobacteria bacterium]